MKALSLLAVLLFAVNAIAADSFVGRCDQTKALLVDISVNNGEYNDRSMKNLAFVTSTALTQISKELVKGEVSQILSVYGEEGEASFCLSSCAHGIGSGLEREFSEGLKKLRTNLASLSRPGTGFVTVSVKEVAHFSDCGSAE